MSQAPSTIIKVPGFSRGVCIDRGGEDFTIQVDGRRYTFEWHPRFGPVVLDRQGQPLKREPLKVIRAASLWNQQGRRVEDGLCVWDHPPKAITKHIAGRHSWFVGYAKPERGG